MARRKTGSGIGIVLAIGAIIILGGIMKIIDSVGAIGFVALILVIAGGIVTLVVFLRKRRRDALMQKYGDRQVVDAIISKNIWQGQTSEQLVDSLGGPVDTDYKVLKTKKKEIWKYHHRGGNRYGLRVTLENDVIVGWEMKQ